MVYAMLIFALMAISGAIKSKQADNDADNHWGQWRQWSAGMWLMTVSVTLWFTVLGLVILN